MILEFRLIEAMISVAKLNKFQLWKVIESLSTIERFVFESYECLHICFERQNH